MKLKLTLKWLGRLARFRVVSVACVIGLVVLWVRSSNHIDMLIFPAPAGSAGVIGAEYGVITLGWKSDREAAGMFVPAGFHTVSSNDDDNDPEAQFDPTNASTSTGASNADTENNRRWLAHGLIQYMLLSGDNEAAVDFSFVGFGVVTASEPCANGSVSIPDWFPIVLIGLIAGWRKLRSSRRARLSRQRRCLLCGYDLRVTPSRCPECGAVPLASAGGSG